MKQRRVTWGEVRKFDGVKARFGDFTLRDRGSYWRVLGSMADICHWLASIQKPFLFWGITKLMGGRVLVPRLIEIEGKRKYFLSSSVAYTRPADAPTWDFEAWGHVSKMQGQLEIIKVTVVQSGVHGDECARAAESSTWWPMSTGTWMPVSVLWKGIRGHILNKPFQELHCASLVLDALSSTVTFSKFFFCLNVNQCWFLWFGSKHLD